MSSSSSSSSGSGGPPPVGLGTRGGSVGSVGFSVCSHHTYAVATQHSNGTQATVVTPSSTQSEGIHVVRNANTPLRGVDARNIFSVDTPSIVRVDTPSDRSLESIHYAIYPQQHQTHFSPSSADRPLPI